VIAYRQGWRGSGKLLQNHEFSLLGDSASAPASLLNATVKDPDLLPGHLLADEKHTRFHGEKAYVATIVAKECILGVGLADTAGTEDLTQSYAHFKEEALNLKPDYQPKTVNTDGW